MTEQFAKNPNFRYNFNDERKNRNYKIQDFDGDDFKIVVYFSGPRQG